MGNRSFVHVGRVAGEGVLGKGEVVTGGRGLGGWATTGGKRKEGRGNALRARLRLVKALVPVFAGTRMGEKGLGR